MKKACLLIFFISLFGISYAQTWNTYSGTFYTTAPVGIGTTAQSMFNVNGGGSVFGVNSTINNTDGAVSLGNMGISYAPTGSNWNTTGSTLLLNDGGYSTIAFHHNGNGVDFIRSGIRTVTLGYDGGFGAANVLVPASLGVGTTTPLTRLHVLGNGASIDAGNSYTVNGDDLAVQGNTGAGRSTTMGAQLEFVIPANTDGTNPWGQGRIITIAGNSNNQDATGKMILGTRRMFNKLGTGAQWYYGNDLTIDGGGNIGIGTTSPSNNLQIGTQTSAVTSSPLTLSLGATYSSTAGANPKVKLYDDGGANPYGFGISAYQMDAIVPSGGNFAWYEAGSQKMILNSSGNLLIGKSTQYNSAYLLDVAGSVRSNAVVVNSTGADFVFGPKYKLAPLPLLEKYINQNHRLPEIPSAKKMQANGLNVGENETKLLQKVEELTLYLIEKDKELKKQQEELDLIKKKLQALTVNKSKKVKHQ